MENEAISRMKIEAQWTKPYKIFASVWWIVGAVIFLASGPGLSDERNRYIWGMRYCMVYHSYYYDDEVTFYGRLFLLGLLITIVVFALPYVVKKYHFFIASRCYLTLEENQLVGTLKLKLSTMKIQMPIEKLDNVFTSNSISDAFRGGETVAVHSNSGVVKFHFVQNAEEFAALAVKQIEKYERAVAVQSASIHTVDNSSLTEKLSELQKLKEQGLLSEEEFNQKKKQILGI